MTAEGRANAFHIKLAGKVIRIEPMYEYLQKYCGEYVTDDPEEFTVRTEASDISYEREQSEVAAEKEGYSVSAFSDAYLETLAVYRKIAEKLLNFDIILMHGSVIAVDGVAYMFTAQSGTGKSTHTRLWREHFGDRAMMINDDKPLLEMQENGVTVYGTPWCGKHNLNTNTAVPLKAICVLTRDIDNHIEKLNPRDIYSILFQQIYRPANPELLLKTMKLIDSLLENVEFYRLGCNMNPEAAIVSYEGMNGGTV